MIFITGDTHHSKDIEKIRWIKNEPYTMNDYLIILGDTAIVWHGNDKDKEIQKWYQRNIPCTVLIIDGNHDNHKALKEMPVECWNGGKIHRITEQIIHLMRGEVYIIEGKKFFAMGGGNSVDKQYRTEGVSWWAEEMPSFTDYYYATENLKNHNNKVDYILTHECPKMFLKDVIPDWAYAQFGKVEPNNLNYFLDDIYNKIEFKKWYCGHYHNDVVVNDKLKCLYNDVLEIR